MTDQSLRQNSKTPLNHHTAPRDCRFLGRRHAMMGLAALGASVGLSACTPRPGQRNRVGEVIDSLPERSAMEATARLLHDSFGGRYLDDRLHSYIAAVGRLLGGESSGAGAVYSYTILNSRTVNIFVLPDGKIFLTRGLLALANSEAELAAALATAIILHKKGTISKLWNEWRYETRSGQLLGTLINGTDLYDLTNLQLTPALAPMPLPWMRSADDDIASVMLDAGYDPMALVSLAATAQQSAALDAMINNIPGQTERIHFARQYPREVDLLADQIATIDVDPATPPSTDRILYLAQIDGLIYGSDPAVGYLDEGYFVAPGLGLTFQIPPSFSMVSGIDMVTAFGPNGSGFSIDLTEDPRLPRADVYIREILGRQLHIRKRLRGIEQVRINGMEAATSAARIFIEDGAMDMRLVAVRVGRNHMARMVFTMPAELTQSLSLDLRRTTYSLRTLAANEGAGYRAHRLRVVTARTGDSLQTFARQLPYRNFRAERLATLNGLPVDGLISVGDRLKVVTS